MLKTHFMMFCISLLLTGCMQFTYDEPPSSSGNTDQDWIITHTEANALFTADHHIMLWDARLEPDPSLEAVTWQEFSHPDPPLQGLLLDDLQLLAERIHTRRVSSQHTVLILDDPLTGWGEGGRLLWMLRALGHTKSHLIMAPEHMHESNHTLVENWLKHTSEQPQTQPDLSLQPNTELTATHEHVHNMLERVQAGEVVLIDTREAREYAGETPYGEQRGGHIPGAKHIYFKDLLSTEGNLKPPSTLLAMLKIQGITPDKEIIAYCTGGIRSAWLVVVLKELGFTQVRNYAGSMWEWSAQNNDEYPLE